MSVLGQSNMLAIVLSYLCPPMKLFSFATLRSTLPIILLSLLFAACGKEKRFTVIGEFTNMPEQRVRLQELGIDDKTVVVDSGRTENGKFELAAEASEPGLYQLIFEKGDYIILSYDGSNIKLSGDYRQVSQYTVKGSPASQSIHGFLRVVNEHIRDIRTLDDVIRQLHASGRDSSIASAQQDLADVSTGLTQYIERYADTTKYLPNALFAVRILNPNTEEPYVSGFVQTLPKRFNNAPQAKEFADRWNKMIAARNAAGQPQQQTFTGGPVMGAVAPAINLPTPEGQTFSLASLKGKYVLVDFWASWCGPCRAENPNVVAAYQKYKDKNFTILGVSLDDNKEKWQQAIKADELSWTHVSDLKRWASIAARDYGIESIPANFLVDKEGKIIARDLRGPALEQKLAEVLQ